MDRTTLINRIIEKRSYKSYLEIGVGAYENYNNIICMKKTNVDPFSATADNVMTSDDFFRQLNDKVKFDIIFIDGLHLSEQVDKDIDNSLKHLTCGGTIVVHDCLPIIEEHQTRSPTIEQWTGDVWKSMLKLKIHREDLLVQIVDLDWGCGIVRRGQQDLYIPPFHPFNWQFYTEEYKKIIPVLSAEEFFNEMTKDRLCQ